MIDPAYIQPIAYHRDHAHRLLLKDEAGTWYLWQGDGCLVEIEHSLAQWIYQRPEIYPLPKPGMWFDVTALPVPDSGILPLLGD